MLTSTWETCQDRGRATAGSPSPGQQGSPTGSPGLGCRRLWKRAHRRAARNFSAQSFGRAASLPRRPNQSCCRLFLTWARLLGTLDPRHPVRLLGGASLGWRGNLFHYPWRCRVSRRWRKKWLKKKTTKSCEF